MEYRPIGITDAEAFWDLQKQLDFETDFMMFEPDERQFDLVRLERNVIATEFLIAAVDMGKMVGFISAQQGRHRRNQHTAYIMVGILLDYQHLGIGTQFFKLLNEWAFSKKISRLELTVEVTNQAALGLYEKFGFKIEGVRTQAMYVAGNYIDEYYMSKVF